MRVPIAILLIVFIPVSVSAWGEKGHLMINQLAMDVAAPKLPEFMNAALEQIIYNGFEPDRWRREEHTPMNIAQEVDHFFDAEKWGAISTIPSDRYLFLQQLVERKGDLKVGYVPYAIIENYGRLVNAFRFWRNAKTPTDRQSASVNAIYVAGVLGHYVGDGSQPMHLTIHHHGWAVAASNPKRFTTDPGIHSRYEADYVNVAIDADAVRRTVRSPERLANVWDSIKQYLSETFLELVPLYELEKAGEFKPDRPRAKGTGFIAAELSRAGTMLAALWYTAWLESAEPARTPPPSK